MKSHFFHLMPYQHLPVHFATRYRSVWVDVPSHLYDPVKGHAIYNEYLDELEHADQAGFDGLCVNEHHSNAHVAILNGAGHLPMLEQREAFVDVVTGFLTR
jgi:pimeloyl-ACP methyl ester carboxylesterase